MIETHTGLALMVLTVLWKRRTSKQMITAPSGHRDQAAPGLAEGKPNQVWGVQSPSWRKPDVKNKQELDRQKGGGHAR